jgi:hypothetical protein
MKRSWRRGEKEKEDKGKEKALRRTREKKCLRNR